MRSAHAHDSHLGLPQTFFFLSFVTLNQSIRVQGCSVKDRQCDLLLIVFVNLPVRRAPHAVSISLNIHEFSTLPLTITTFITVRVNGTRQLRGIFDGHRPYKLKERAIYLEWLSS